ncbi:putative polyketide synthase [Coniochaeta sp. 2T2.1]|nr:putative polyketide synthase [Coniochaeta sp. 2T2.1]
MRIYVFGDQAIRVEEQLLDLLHVKGCSILTTFLREATIAVQEAVAGLPPAERAAFPPVETLGFLLDAVKKGSSHVALDSALVCIYEIGYYIRYLQHTDSIHPPPASCVVGLCTGSLAAAAISCSRDLPDLVRLGRVAVTLAFRLGMQAHRKAVMLTGTDEASHAQPSSWSVLVPGMTSKEALEAIAESCEESNASPLSRPYISAVGHSSISLSGPPESLRSLLSHTSMAAKRKHPIGIHAPYHAAHLYSQQELAQMIPADPDMTDLLARKPVILMVSSSSSEPTSFGSLLQQVVADILQEPIRLDRIFDRLSEAAAGSTDSTAGVHIIPINTHVGKGLAEYLTQNGRSDCHCEDVPRPQLWLQGQGKTEGGRQAPGGYDTDSSEIAIIGFSGRFPEADGLDEFWDLLSKGLDVHGPIPPDRFDGEAHYDATGARRNTSKVLDGCWIREPGLFDPRFFHMSPKEACQSDPAQRLALLTAYEALEMAGFVAGRTPSSQKHRVGVFYGTTSDDWREVNSGQDVGTYFIPGGNRAFIPGRINYFFNFSGPSVSVDTACSSSLAAIDIACSSLLRRNCDTAIAGGTNIMTNPDNFAGLDRGHFLSHTGNCKTFDESADGYCRADGVGSVVLKRLSDAIQDHDPIYGVILGSYTNHSAESVSITRPLADAQEYLFRRLLNESHISPHEISYIEMHGTGTQAGDAVEMRSVLNTFAWDHSRKSPLHLGSVKANVGHGESASGVTALIKVLLMMRKNRIPPHCGIKGKINSTFPTDLDKRQVRIALGGEADWSPTAGNKRRALVNNFSAAGGNTGLLLEDAPKLAVGTGTQPDQRPYHVVTLSARSSDALQRNLRALAAFVKANPSPDLLPRLAYTTTARRLHHSRRVAVVASSAAQLEGLLLSKAETVSDILPTRTAPAVGFLFTGQGAQQTAMARGLYENFSYFRDEINRMDSVAQGQGFDSVVPLVNGAVPIEDLSPTVIQLGTCIIQMALAGFWQNLGLKPSYVLGHSLGEYAAMHVAGVLSVADAIYLTGYRARLLETHCVQDTHGMVAVKQGVSELKAVLATHRVEVACINGSTDTVLSGECDVLDQACETLSQQGLKFTRLNLPYAFHSTQVEPILDKLEEAARRVQFRQPTIPIVSPLLAAVVRGNRSALTIGPEYIRRHCREAVDFWGAVRAAQADSLMPEGSVAVEIGAHPILSSMVRSVVGQSLGLQASIRRNEDVFKTLSETLAALHLSGLPLDWNEYHRDFPASQTVLELPRYSWDLANYWIQYEGNWCLDRGAARQLPATAAPKSTRLSPSVQTIVEEKVDVEHAHLIAEATLQDEELLPVCHEHRVNGLILCPSSLYADIAYSLASHLLNTHKPDWASENLSPDICDMAVEKALVVQPEGSQVFRAEMDLQWSTRRGSMQIYSVDASGQRRELHAKCNVVFGSSTAWREEWQRQLYLIRRSMEQLRTGVDQGSTHKLRRSLAYKLFSSVVEYGPRYQGLDEVVFDSEAQEATAVVRLQPVPEKYGLNPFWCDSIGHLTGFVMNSNASPDLAEYAFVNHGWRSMRITEKLCSEEVYQTYVKMQPVGDGDSMFAGDVYLLRDNTIVAVFGSVTFQKVSRRVLEMLLPRPKKSNVGSKPALPAARAPPPAATKPNKMDEGSVKFQQLVKVITSEIGVTPDQLPEDALFADFGVDSLMTLTIIGSIRESTGLDVPASLLEEYPTLGSLREYLGLGNSSTSSTSDAGDSSPSGSMDTGATTVTTPASADELERGAAVGPSTVVDFLLAIIADEIGLSTKSLLQAQDLADLGFDSLLSLTVLGRAREELDLDLPPQFFDDNPTISKVKSAVEKMLGLTPATTKEAPPRKEATLRHPAATSTLLQGNDSCTKTLFLFPDGSGSAGSYAMVPTISPDVRVFGLNCPYIKNPQALDCALQDLTPSYVAEIRHRQPRGPYNLAGWSAGGIAAYDAAQYLIQQGEAVDRLILLDSPNPISLEKLPPRFYHFLESAGVFGSAGGKKAPDWLIQHFLAFIDALDRYKPVPFAPAHAVPRTTIIWAKDGVCKNSGVAKPEPRADDTREMTWLLNDREDLAFNGWDTLLGRQNIGIRALEEVNHFSMVRMPGAAGLAKLIREALD